MVPVLHFALGAAAVMVPAWWIWRRVWRKPSAPTEAELARRTSSGAHSAGMRWRRLRDGSRVVFHEFGAPEGRVVVALHGLGVTGRMYAAHDGLFRARGVRCIAPTLVGGWSEPAPQSTLADLARTAVGLVDELGIEKFDVIGSSFGTLPGLALCALVPARVTRAGLFGPMLPGPWLAANAKLLNGARPNDRLLWSMAARFPAGLYPMMALFGAAPRRAQVRSFIDDSLSDAERASLQPGHPFHDEVASLLEEGGQRGFWGMALGTEIAFGRPPGFTLEQVGQGGVPLHLEVGERDNAHLPAFAEYLHRHVRHSTVHRVPGVGRFNAMGPLLEAGLARYLSL